MHGTPLKRRAHVEPSLQRDNNGEGRGGAGEGRGGRHSARGRLRWTKNSKPGGQLQNKFENPADVDHKQGLLHGFCKDHYRTPPQMKNTRAHAGSIYTSNAYTHNTQAKAISHMCIYYAKL